MNTEILKQIKDGFKNYAFKDEDHEELALVRSKICAACPHANPKLIFKLMLPDKTLKDIEGLGCDICKCSLSAKVRSYLTSCPEDKW